MRRLPALVLLGLGACAVDPLPSAPGTLAPGAPPRFILLADTQETMALEFWRPSHGPIRFAPVLIAVLDSNFDELTAEQIRTQDAWLETLLAAAESDAAVRHVIVVCHHPPYTNAHGLSDSREVQDHFVTRLTPKVKVFFSGHVHNYERFRKREVHYLVSGGAGGPTRTVETDNPRHDPLYTGPRTRPFHYCRFTVGDGSLRCDVMMLQEDGAWKRVDGFGCP